MATTRKKKASKKKVSKKKDLKQPTASKQSLTGAPVGDEDWETKEARWKAILDDRAKRALALRSEDREFHGLEREFRYHQAEMLLDYEKTKDLKHPRDLGDSREKILRKFLVSGCLPGRYAVSDRSVRVVSTSGHMSREIDIALYDRLDAITLMNREDVYQALPLENVYGVIQVKSRLSAATIEDGLKNLVSFKSLSRQTMPTPKVGIFMGPRKSERGFGLLFAYDSDLSLADIMAEVKNFSATRQPRDWANLVFVLNKGFIFHGEANTVCYTNETIEKIQSLQMQGRPDRDGTGLYSFYSLLLELLRGTETGPADTDAYLRLPMVAGEYSYRFSMGMFREFGVCPEHGDYARKISADQLEKVITWCRTSKPINWIRAHHIAYGQPEDEAAYARQPGDVYIYNPDQHPLSQMLTGEAPYGEGTIQSLAYDAIDTAGMQIWIPFYYSALEGIVSDCPECAKKAAKTATRSDSQGAN